MLAHSRLFLLMILPCLLIATGASGADPLDLRAGDRSRWSIGPLVSTYSGPSHEDVLRHVNRMMPLLASDPGYRFNDFDVGIPLSARLLWAANPVVSFSATYGYSQFSTEAYFNPFAWDSERSLTTDLHELTVALHYGLTFVRSRTIMPYLGGGLNFALADSKLCIGLVNAPGVPENQEIPDYPDQSFEITSRDNSIGAVALAGLVYNIGTRISLTAEIQGIMGQIAQHFDYGGSLQYITPEANVDFDDPRVNDILMGVYPLELNGIRLTIGMLIGI